MIWFWAYIITWWNSGGRVLGLFTLSVGVSPSLLLVIACGNSALAANGKDAISTILHEKDEKCTTQAYIGEDCTRLNSALGQKGEEGSILSISVGTSPPSTHCNVHPQSEPQAHILWSTWALCVQRTKFCWLKDEGIPSLIASLDCNTFPGFRWLSRLVNNCSN